MAFKYRDLMSSLALAVKKEDEGGCPPPSKHDEDEKPCASNCGNNTCKTAPAKPGSDPTSRRAAELPFLQEQLRDTLAQEL